MTGMNRNTGKRLSGAEHLRQSLGDLFSTMKGERVMRPLYGSDVPALVDNPITATTSARLAAAVTDTVGDWEPRCTLKKCQLSSAKNTANSFSLGKAAFDLEMEIKEGSV